MVGVLNGGKGGRGMYKSAIYSWSSWLGGCGGGTGEGVSGRLSMYASKSSSDWVEESMLGCAMVGGDDVAIGLCNIKWYGVSTLQVVGVQFVGDIVATGSTGFLLYKSFVYSCLLFVCVSHDYSVKYI
jgi:hypothetical protein